MSAALGARGLTKRFGTFALEGIDLAVPRGAITGLVGANGAGKSTLLNLALGLLAPDAGELRLFGEDALRHGARLRARVGFVQEAPPLPGHLRIGELGRLVAPFYPTWDEAAFRRIVAAFEVPVKTPFSQLSQGNRMKAALSLALAHRPELLLLDEPTSGLDPLARREFLDLLLEVVQDERRAVLFSTHVTSDLDRVADHVAFLQAGRLALSGEREALADRWSLVRGGQELLEPSLGLRIAGGQRSEVGIELLCESPLPPLQAAGLSAERPRLEDLVYLFGRPLDVLPEAEACAR